MRRLALTLVLSGLMVFSLAAMAMADTPNDQWSKSKHNIKNVDTTAEDVPSKRDNCISCHDGQGFANNLTKRADLPATAKGPNSIDCNVCHGKRGSAIMTSGNTDKLANGLQVKGAGAGALCISCHNGRKLPDAAKKPAPHRSPQSDVLYATVGAKTPGKTYPSSPHGANPNSCVTCHMAQLGGIPNHTFKVVDKPDYVEKACGSCHSGLTRINRTALADYDGDKVVEGIQDEVKGLMALLEKAAADKEKELGATFGENHGAFAWKDKANAAAKVPEVLYNARFNLALVEEDGSHGIHNPAYVVSLLQDSYKQLTGQDVPGAALR